MIKHFCKVTGVKRSTVVAVGLKALMRRPAGIVSLTKLQQDKCMALAHFVREYTTAEYLEENTTLDSSQKAMDFCKKLFLDMADRERCYLVMLDAQNRYIAHTLVAEGTLCEAPIYLREMVKVIILNNANSVIFAHNHPGGSLKFSSADIAATKNFKTALDTVQCKLLDSIVCTPDGGAASMTEKGLI